MDEAFDATVLFLDISGFVDLSNRLSAQGAVGAETLSTILNTFFEHVIDTVYAFEGDVVKLAGDGMIAVWDAKAFAKGSAVLNAVWCAFRIQDQCAELSLPELEKLLTKIGLANGQIHMLCVGGVQDRWELIPSGPSLIEACEAEQRARPGEIVASPGFWEEVKAGIQGERLPNKYYLLKRSGDANAASVPIPDKLPPTAANHLKSFLPRSVLSRLDRGILNWIGELRRVTVLFVYPGKRFNPRALALDEIQKLTLDLQKLVYHFGGNINKWTVDEKGTGLIVGFGLPPKAHEDDPARAVTAALEIERLMAEIGIEGGIGLATGTIYCGLVGSSRRREYTVIGPAVNRAARLAFAAKELILCDEATRYASQVQFQFQAATVQHLKGLPQDLKVFTPSEIGAEVTAPMEVIGHSHAMRAFGRGFRSLLDGESTLLMLEGEAGIGKSTLVRHWRDQARSNGIRVVAGAGKSIQRTTPYFAWRNALRELLGLNQLSDPAAARARIEDMLGLNSRLKLFIPLINDIVPLELPENFMTKQMVGKIRGDNTRLVVAALVAEMARKERFAVIIEDLHWCDSQSIALIEAVSNETKPILIVVSSRPVTGAELKNPLFTGSQRALQRIELKNLDSSESRELVCRKLGVNDVASSVIDFIFRKSLGNPLFTEEIAYALVESGLVTTEDGSCRQRPGAAMEAVEMPGHLRGVVTQRIDRLAQPTQIAAKVASVIGERFPTDLLREIYPLEHEKSNLGTHLTRLEQYNILLHMTDSELPSYGFSHVLIHEAIYGLILFEHRKALHEAIAIHLEQSEPIDLRMSAVVLGHHWEKAGNRAKSNDYLSLAGERAIQDGGYQEGLELIDRVINTFNGSSLMPSDSADKSDGPDHNFDLGRWYCLRAEAQLGLGRLMESAESFLRAAELLGDPFPKTLEMNCVVQACLSELQDSISNKEKTQFGEAERKRYKELVRCFEVLSLLNLFSNNLTACLAAAHKGLVAAAHLVNSPERARALAMLALGLSLVPQRRTADKYIHLALREARNLKQEFTQARVCEFVGMYYMACGRWQEAEEAFQTAIAGFRNMGDLRRRIECTCLLSTFQHYRGLFGKRVVMGMEVSDLGQTSGDLQAKAWGQLDQIESLICLGELETSQRLADELIGSIGQHIIGADIIMAYGLVARLNLRLEKLDLAADFAAKCLDHMQQGQPTIVYNLEAYAGATETLLTAWQQAMKSGNSAKIERAQRLARDACHELRRYARVFPIAIPRYLLLLGRMEKLSGDTAAALRCTRWGLKAASRLGMPYEEALAKWQLSQWLDASDAARRMLLEEADTLFTRLNASYESRQTRAAIQHLESIGGT